MPIIPKTPKIHLRAGGQRTVHPTLAEALGADPSREPILFVQPHDDDAVVHAGMTIALLAAEGFDVHVALATGGEMGYCSLEERGRIAEIRRAETVKAYGLLGLAEDRIHFLGFADGDTYRYIGRRVAGPGDPELGGYTGLENSLTWIIRRIAPRRIFTPASSDLHPDHQAVNKELLISLYHATGDIWPELGLPCAAVPEVFEYPCYVALNSPPDMMIEAGEAFFERKLAAIGCYASQRQIALTIAAVREGGPVEFLRNLRFAFYRPATYRALFEE